MLLPTAVLFYLASEALAEVSYTPLRPPALPIAVRAPYSNIWTSTREDQTLNENGIMIWTGRDIGWSGIAAVDGNTCVYMGHGAGGDDDLAEPKSVEWDSQYSNFTFDCHGVDIKASFLSPTDPNDICRTSIPLSYLQVSAVSNDGKDHRVQLYSDVNGAWNTDDGSATLEWDYSEGKGNQGVDSFKIHLKNEIEFGESADTALYGDVTFNSAKGDAHKLSYQGGSSSDASRAQFREKQKLSGKLNKDFRGYDEEEPVVAYAHDLGKIKKDDQAKSVLYTIGTLQDPGVQYNTTEGVKKLAPWWKKCYKDADNLIKFHYNDFENAVGTADKFEAQLRKDVTTYYGGESSDLKNPGSNEQDSYYAIVALSTRQIMGAYLLVERPESVTDNGLPYAMQKEISSNGNMNTVDVIFPAFPFWAYTNIDMLRWTLDPMFQLQEDKLFAEDYCMHDIGGHFPNATGQGYGDSMPLEESGNAIIMALAYHEVSQDTKYLKDHYDLLKKYNNYLLQYSRYPDNQLSTDDFAGKLENQTNLAMKGLVGIQAMSKIAEIVGEDDDSKNFTQLATDYYKVWKDNAVVKNDDGEEYTLLSYNDPDSWGILYNVWPSYAFDLNIADGELLKDAKRYSETLKARMNKYGVPLDSRHTYTKSDWEMWMAAYVNSDLRTDLVNTLARFLQDTPTDKAFTDWYETLDGSYPDGTFIARPVVGGHFAMLVNSKIGGKDHSDV